MQTQRKVSQKCYLTPFPHASSGDFKNIWDYPPPPAQLKSKIPKWRRKWPSRRSEVQQWSYRRRKEQAATVEVRGPRLSLDVHPSVLQRWAWLYKTPFLLETDDSQDSWPYCTSKEERWQGSYFRILYCRPEQATGDWGGTLTLPGRKFHEEPGYAG